MSNSICKREVHRSRTSGKKIVHKTEEKKNHLSGDEDIFCKPNMEKLLYPKPCNYDKLGEEAKLNYDKIKGKLPIFDDLNGFKVQDNNLILIDGKYAPKGLKNYKTIINGDEKEKVISAASIVAKVFRDKLMIKLSKKFKH